ncbi:MAG: hypothetical protein ACHQE5_00900 [Actinomycetes bacterium]
MSPSWKRHAVVAAIVVVGTVVVLNAAALAVFAVVSWIAFPVLLVVLALCGWAATRFGWLPMRWVAGVAVLLWAGSVLVAWSGEDGLAGRLRIVLLNAIYVGAFAVGAREGGRASRRKAAD